MASDRKPVVVKFPVDLLAKLDELTKATGAPRMVMIVRAVEAYVDSLAPPASGPVQIARIGDTEAAAVEARVKVDKLPPGMKAIYAATTAPHVDIQLGPTPVVPGSRLKKGKLR